MPSLMRATTTLPRRRPMPRAWVMACLALVLLWAQMGGWLHGLSHQLLDLRAPLAPAAQAAQAALQQGHVHHLQGEATLGHADQVCQDCLAFAALAFAAPGTPALPTEWAGPRDARPWLLRAVHVRPSAFWAYRTRAPPGA